MPLHTPLAERLKGAVLALIVQAAIGYALWTGLAMHRPGAVEQSLSVFRVLPDPPPPPPGRIVPPPRKIHRPTGAAAPPNLRSKATEIVAPVPVVQIPLPPPVIVAPIAATGAQATSGASDRAGPGTGAGGIGNGTGAGGYGDGDGSGAETPPRWRRGRLSMSDSPLPDDDVTTERTVGVRYTVTAQGRVTECEITRSSGAPLLDRTTCALIEKRFRYDPARDAQGRPVDSTIVENHSFMSDVEPPRER